MKIRTLVLAILLPWMMFAQSPVLKLKTGTFALPEGVQELAFKQAVDAAYYGYLQSHQILSSAEKKELESKGIVVLDYLPEKTYHVKISSSVNWNEIESNKLVRTLMPIPPNQKLQAHLAKGNYPSHALITPDIIRIRASLFRGVNPESASAILTQAGYSNHQYHSPTHTIILDLDVKEIEKLAEVSVFSFLAPIEPDPEPENLVGRTNHRSNVLDTRYAGGRKYDGTGVLVGMNDDGTIGPHIDYQGRVDQSFVSGNSGNHGDHVAGTIVGAGNIDPTTEGMAPGASLYVYNVWDAIDFIDTYYFNPGIRLTSTSYGNGCNAGYTAYARTADQDVRQLPSLMHVFSAGNSGTSNCGYGAGSGWGNITGGIKAGKNVMAIGNVLYTDALANSSSRGPSSDGRIKPDVCAVGTSVLSTIDPNTYASFTGTSMACPGVTGTMAQLYQAYKTLYGSEPDAGMIKAILLNTADDKGNPGPDYKYGWGRINAHRAVEQIESFSLITDSISNGGNKTFNIPVNTNLRELRVMVYWTDFEGSAGASVALVNDLDITLTEGGNTFSPWVLDPTPNASNLNAPATTGVDDLNNMEQVFIANPAQGTYTLNISGTAVPMGPQKFYVVITSVEEEMELTYPMGGEAFVPGTQETIRWDHTGGSGNITLEYSTDNGATWNQISNSISGGANYYNWTPSFSITTEQAKIRVSRGSLVDESDTTFVIARVPNGLQVDMACPDSMTFSWNATSGVSDYELMILGPKYMDSLIHVSGATSVTVGGINPFQEQWFTIRSVLPNGGKGRRAIAINPATGLKNCNLTNDVNLAEILSPQSPELASCLSLDSLEIEVLITNDGADTAQGVNLYYQVNGGTINSEPLGLSLAPGGSVNHVFNGSLNLSSPGIVNLKVWVDMPSDQNAFNDTIDLDLEVYSSTLVSLPYTQNFDGFVTCATSIDCGATICNLNSGWRNFNSTISDAHDWRTHSGSTSSSTTGPTGDHTGGGNYLYTEASGGCNFVTAIMASPCIDLSTTTQPFMSFWYHMYGARMGSLHIDVLVDGSIDEDVWVQPGAVGNFWAQDSIDLSAYNGKVIQVLFRGITGEDYRSDMAIDDVRFRDAFTLTADFEHSGDCVSDPITFTDQSIGNLVSWAWDFGPNASPATATGQGPHTVNFTSTSNLVSLLVTDSDGGTDSFSNTVVLDTTPTGNISFTNPSPGTYNFDAQSPNANNYSWTFGDGNSSTQANPSHTYSSNGNYTVTVVISNPCGSKAITETVNVSNLSLEDEEAMPLRFYPNPTLGVLNLESGDYDLTYSLVNALGESVSSGSLSSRSKSSLNLSSLPNGIYILEVMNENEVYRFEVIKTQ